MADIVKSLLVYNSITNTLNDEKMDLKTPFSFIEFLDRIGALVNSNTELQLYQTYLKNWEATTTTTLTSINADIKTQFITFLSELKLKFSTLEEKRYFDNIDFTNDEQLTVAVPFFATKIKEICLYFAKKRNQITRDLNYTKTKGSLKGATTFIRNEIENLYVGDDIPPDLVVPDDLTQFLRDIEIEIEPQYDVFNDYYDLDPFKEPTFYDVVSGERYDFFTSNTNSINSNYFLDSEQIINDIINGQGIILEEIPELTIKSGSTDISLIDNINFVNYKNTGVRSDLKYLLDAELIQNYMGVDMYYLSANSIGNYVYEKLFTATSPYRNLLNINNPGVQAIPGDDIRAERSIGLFFKPSNVSILKMDVSFEASLVKENIEPNKTYIFPDPSRYGKVTGLGGSVRENPFIFTYNNNEFKNYSSSYGKSLPKNTGNGQNFYSYSSSEQRNFKFNNTNPVSKIQSILQSGNIFKEVSDIYGNTYLIQNVSDFSKKNIDPSQIINISSPVSNVNTVYNSAWRSGNILKDTIFSIRNAKKDIFIYNIIKDTVEPIGIAYKNIFARYKGDATLYTDLQANNIYDIYLFGTTIIIVTPTRFVIDNIKYTTEGDFLPGAGISKIHTYSKGVTLRTQSYITNPIKINREVYYARISGTAVNGNERKYVFSLYKYDIDLKQETEVISSSTLAQAGNVDNFIVSIGTGPVQIKNSLLSYNSKQEKFTLLINLTDLNGVNIYYILVFNIKGTAMNIYINTVFEPSNFTTTQNFTVANTLTDNFHIQTISSTPTQNISNGNFRF